MIQDKTNKISNAISQTLEAEIDTLLKKINATNETGASLFQLPVAKDVLEDPLQISQQIAMASNAYSESVRIAGMARANFKIAEARYKYKFRTNLGTGKNAAEREAKAMDAAQQEYDEMVYLSAIVELSESIESSCRIASESARRMLLTVNQLYFAEGRSDRHS